MAPRDAEATRRRLLEAAAAEFAELGISGARVDRIAKAAQTNKAQIYHYFGSKGGLFTAVLAMLLHEILESDPFDAGDLAETAGRIFDDFEDRPDLARLATWYRLERSEADPPNAAIVEANARKVVAIRAAQRDGRVTDAFPADVLLGLLISVATTWASLPPEYTPSARNNSRRRRRAAVVEAARRLAAPDPTSG
jgi:AcrR family transcriptional regulator